MLNFSIIYLYFNFMQLQGVLNFFYKAWTYLFFCSSSGLQHPAPLSHIPAGRSHSSGRHEDYRVPHVCHILTYIACQPTNHRHHFRCSENVCVLCVYTPSSSFLLSAPPRGFQGFTSFALITPTWEWIDRFIFPTLHAVAQQQYL